MYTDLMIVAQRNDALNSNVIYQKPMLRINHPVENQTIRKEMSKDVHFGVYMCELTWQPTPPLCI